jgi:hypothetical protein
VLVSCKLVVIVNPRVNVAGGVIVGVIDFEIDAVITLVSVNGMVILPLLGDRVTDSVLVMEYEIDTVLVGGGVMVAVCDLLNVLDTEEVIGCETVDVILPVRDSVIVTVAVGGGVIVCVIVGLRVNVIEILLGNDMVSGNDNVSLTVS